MLSTVAVKINTLKPKQPLVQASSVLAAQNKLLTKPQDDALRAAYMEVKSKSEHRSVRATIFPFLDMICPGTSDRLMSNR